MSGKTWVTNLSRDELVAVGMPILINCVNHFNPEFGYKFGSYLCKALSNRFSRSSFLEAKQQQRRLDDEDGKATGILPAHGHDTELADGVLDLRQAINENWADLSEIEMFIIRMRFGIGDAEVKTLAEIGLIVGLTKERIRQIQEKAIRKLRYYMDETIGISVEDD
jgi:RNA polymerase sigma factor (sigma-70 family)